MDERSVKDGGDEEIDGSELRSRFEETLKVARLEDVSRFAP